MSFVFNKKKIAGATLSLNNNVTQYYFLHFCSSAYIENENLTDI